MNYNKPVLKILWNLPRGNLYEENSILSGKIIYYNIKISITALRRIENEKSMRPFCIEDYSYNKDGKEIKSLS